MAGTTKLVKMEGQVAQASLAWGRLLTPAQAAEALSIPESTLAQWRSQRRGPAFIKLEGRLVRYRTRDLENYITRSIVEPIAIADA
jgi:hypothetical protein